MYPTSLLSLPMGLWVLLSLACQPATQEGDSAEPDPTTELAAYATRGEIVVHDTALHRYLAPQARIEVLAQGFDWSEGPLWLPSLEMLIFSDVPRNTIYRWQEGDTAASVYLQPSGYTGEQPRAGESGSNGLALDREGQLLLCQHGDRRVARMQAPLRDPESEFTTLAGEYAGKRFNSPNDLCVNQRGQIFFTDPPYGLAQGPKDPTRETEVNGVYRRDPDGSVYLITDQLTRPNGVALSPDEETLYVAVSDPEGARWMAYTLDEAGDPTEIHVFYDATDQVGGANPGLPDGLKVHGDGTLFATGPGGVWVLSPEGRHLGTIRTGLPTSNCALGGGYLYMTADSLLLRVALQ